MTRFLIAHSNCDMRTVLHEALFTAFEEQSGQPPQVIATSNTTEALTHCEVLDFDFIIMSLSLASRPNRPVGEREGLELLSILRNRQCHTPALVVAPTRHPDIDQHARKHSAIVIYEDTLHDTLDATVIGYAKSELSDVPHRSPNRIHVVLDLTCSTFRIFDQQAKMLVPESGPVVIRRQQLAPLTSELTRRVRAGARNWEILLRQLGTELRRELFEHPPNLRFRDAYHRALDRTGLHDDAVWIRFVIGEREQHAFPLEALLAADRDLYWMLQAPLFRSVKGQPKARALFEDPAELRYPINCLLVSADTCGTVDRLQRTFPRMSMTKRECEQIRDELLKHRLDLNVGKVKVISSDDPAEGNAPHRDNLQRILWDEDWHLVHFAGHSYYDEQHKEGYVLLPERLSTVPQLVDARSFAGFFREVPRFVYLSSCESSGDAFVFELANVGIPAVAGFRWNVAETSAFEYAMCFYRHLLAERCLEVAFWKARKEIHDHDATEENLIWASAMLIIQTHWQQADRG